MKVRHQRRQPRPERRHRWHEHAAVVRAKQRAERRHRTAIKRGWRDLLRSGMPRWQAMRAPSIWALARSLRNARGAMYDAMRRAI